MIEPKIGEIFSLHGIKVKTCLMKDDEHCSDCAFAYLDCDNVACIPDDREDAAPVIFREIKEMEVKIQIPDNCELIKDGDTYIVKEKKQEPPRSWEEFCERYPIKKGESYIATSSNIYSVYYDCKERYSKSWCTSKKEAEAFLALMQLRQLRKAWIGDWEQTPHNNIGYILYDIRTSEFKVGFGGFSCFITLSFPTKEMAEDFFNCFRDLCETAKILL